MSLDQLLAVCSPPTQPANVPMPEQWNALEDRLGLTLPADYGALLAHSGGGVFGAYEADGFFDLAYVLSPGEPRDKHGLAALPRMIGETETLAKIRSGHPRLVPVWPDPGGLLYVGGTTTQHCIHWKTTGAPSDWTIMTCDRACDNWFEWHDDLTSFLAALVTNNVPDWIVEGPTRFPLVFASNEMRTCPSSS